jgi:RHS repeat-associated protein
MGLLKPTGIRRATPNPKAAITNIPVLLKATAATELNLRFPGQYDDAETGTFYNYQRQYLASQGRYTQGDPIGLEGGLNRFGYVDGAPLSMIDPSGLDPWYKETMRVYTDRAGQKTMVYTPSEGQVLEFETRNIVSGALDGADGPYEGEWTYCEYPNSREFGTAKWRTTDDRWRWIHGGGTGLKNPLAPRQGWRPTLGCTRAQNEDVEALCKISEAWRKSNPGKKVLYYRQ